LSGNQAFDAAWAIVKMPIVPGSLYHDEDHDDEFERYNAAFDDPKTGERMPLNAIFAPEEYITATIEAPVDPTYRFHPRASGTFVIGAEPDFEDERQNFSATGIGTDPEFRRRGYATAIYDLVAHILDQHGANLEASAERSDDGYDFWESVLSEMDDYDSEIWPVRDDL